MYSKANILLLMVITADISSQSRVQVPYRFDYGPTTMVRFEQERNVFIPCPFPGSAYPSWIINGILYSSLTVPDFSTNIMSTPYGLMIRMVTNRLNGTTFQCIVTNQNYYTKRRSTIGTLLVQPLTRNCMNPNFIHDTTSTITPTDTFGEVPNNFEATGPQNITRFEGETNVYIPCPFPGSSFPIWRINGFYHEALNLPHNMLPVSYGLLITTVEFGMDGTSFQCISHNKLNDNDLEYKRSTLGILNVEKLTPECADYVQTLKQVTITKTEALRSFSLDHQRMIFEDVFKTISWTAVTPCNKSRVMSVSCDDQIHDTWDRNIIQGTSVAIRSSQLIDSNNLLLYLKLVSVNNDGEICQEYPIYFTVNQTDITEKHPTSYNGFCVNVKSGYIVLPSKNGGNDCFCAIILDYHNHFDLSRCPCADQTLFASSFNASLQKRSDSYNNIMCFSNLTRNMNNTIIHFFELYRECMDANGEPVTKPIRVYLQSLKLVIELPYQPTVILNATSGELKISIEPAEGIEVDHYEITLRDNTDLIFVHLTSTIAGDRTSVFLGDVFQDGICSPYNLTVGAYSVQGGSTFTNLTAISISQEDNSDECACIASNVNVGLNFVEDASGSITGIEVNCSQDYYINKIIVEVDILKEGININGAKNIFCMIASQFIPIDDTTLECDQSYDLVAYWISKNATKCNLHMVSQQTTPCQENNTTTKKLIIILCSAASSIILILTFSVLVLILYINVLRRKLNYEQINTRTLKE